MFSRALRKVQPEYQSFQELEEQLFTHLKYQEQSYEHPQHKFHQDVG